MNKKGFSLLELLLALSLSIFLALLFFDLGSRFVSLFRSLEKRGQHMCMCYTALQLFRNDLERAPIDKSLYKDISLHSISYFLPNGSRLIWRYDDKKQTLSRIHFYVKSSHVTRDQALVLDRIEHCNFQVDMRFNKVVAVSISLTHNGRLFETIIKLRNKIL